VTAAPATVLAGKLACRFCAQGNQLRMAHRHAQIIQIYEGTNQVQRMVMARQVLKGW
jgi:alkylation response protein AidB-like acyl-CoA dehydrogenase